MGARCGSGSRVPEPRRVQADGPARCRYASGVWNDAGRRGQRVAVNAEGPGSGQVVLARGVFGPPLPC